MLIGGHIYTPFSSVFHHFKAYFSFAPHVDPGGNLVQVLSHEGRISRYDHFWKGGTEFWDLKNRYNMLVSSGWYIYHVKDLATGETRIGRFAIIQ